eukprot:CAMPEP_0170567378 /NCGR_PEP_ID=MMETSP0211-20121228/80441_1 /TAXON_ID=311385 /ORGANISM="Pseudokeronopsis sp., Strain OXSARD2" /LENGTH=162 /DNA_ID=CAMNT_0010888815 /DNA_START=145 /DNA_END=633 /DNA_ORIENTATION=+
MTQKTKIILQVSSYLSKFQFLTIHSVQMWEMLLIAFIHVKHVPFLQSVHVNSKPAGVGGVVGNKGGLQICFKLHEKIFNFINVHLVHGAKRAEKRHEMMNDLIKKLSVYREELDPDIIADFSFILGDFNYRMNSTFQELVPQIERVLELRPKLDQLYIAMNQ